MAKAFSLLLLSAAATLAGCSSGNDDDGATASADDALTGREITGTIQGTGGSGLRVRSAPSTQSGTVAFLSEGTSVLVACRTTGTTVGGTDAWDYLPRQRGYVSERYVALLGDDPPDCRDALPSSSGSPSPGAPRASAPATPSDLQAALVAEARNWVGTTASGNCQPFSSALGRACEPWCADFLEYVWQSHGVDIDGLTAWAGTFFTYGEAHGTWKSRDAADVMPGDAVVWGETAARVAHVGMVTEVLANGDLVVINGNWGHRVQEQSMSRSTVVGGYGIGGFISPVPAR